MDLRLVPTEKRSLSVLAKPLELIGDWEPRSWEHRQGKEWMFHWRRL